MDSSSLRRVYRSTPLYKYGPVGVQGVHELKIQTVFSWIIFARQP